MTGLYGNCSGEPYTPAGQLRPCLCSKASSGHRAYLLSSIVGDKHLMLHTEPLLAGLPLDSIQLHQQPQGATNRAAPAHSAT